MNLVAKLFLGKITFHHHFCKLIIHVGAYTPISNSFQISV